VVEFVSSTKSVPTFRLNYIFHIEKNRRFNRVFVQKVESMSYGGVSFKFCLKKNRHIDTITIGRNWFYFFTKYKMEG